MAGQVEIGKLKIEGLKPEKALDNLKNGVDRNYIEILKLEDFGENLNSKETEKLAKNLNSVFNEEFAEKGFDFFKAMKAKIKNPIGLKEQVKNT